MVHDSTIDAHLGIGHHPHRYNERIFYIIEGELDHDDSRNNIQGHMGKGDVGLFTEGLTGMVHSEWNNGDVQAHAYILVYSTDPVPSQTAFTALRAADAPVYNEDNGVRTKELVGPRSPLQINGDIRLFTDSALEVGATLAVKLADGEGGLVSVQEGSVTLDGAAIAQGQTVVLPPAEGERSITLEATAPARLLRTVYGPGHGFVRGRPRL
jgi:redox-sensitive bicupin YhaK (pirin superfamily)